MEEIDTVLRMLARRARHVAVMILAGFMRRRRAEDIQARLTEQPPRVQALIVAAVLLGLFSTSMLFAQAGVIGLLVFFLLIILLVK
ncbi:hypothetical protein Ga0609869_002378 [Rhodovulum iodosum]|uniref:Uncharacterized protein n=1 Tax=Rhodovulum iodosum TaxID=68291 RepID=A0ABV3XW78_9RHOB|nr:hypothetical protein [Rhodovulum robiginosum]RSK35071.1 hypothetical protein EJA01_06655 [Rhodovulum robiginosum]